MGEADRRLATIFVEHFAAARDKHMPAAIGAAAEEPLLQFLGEYLRLIAADAIRAEDGWAEKDAADLVDGAFVQNGREAQIGRIAGRLRRAHAFGYSEASFSARAPAMDGWRLVPERPTQKMLKALWEAKDGAESTLDRAASGDVKAMNGIWAAMLSAAPSPEDGS